MAGAAAGAALGVGKILESTAATFLVQETAKFASIFLGANQIARQLLDKL